MPERRPRRTIRKLAFALLLSAAAVAYRAELHAYDAWDSMCDDYYYDYGCICNRSISTYRLEIRCDFSQQEDWQFCFFGLDERAFDACNTVCEDYEYKNWKNWQATGNMCDVNEYDCRRYLDECWFSWGNYSSAGYPSDSYAVCTCQSAFMCNQRGAGR